MCQSASVSEVVAVEFEREGRLGTEICPEHHLGSQEGTVPDDYE